MARQTRETKARELKRLITDGPSLSLDVFGIYPHPKLSKEQNEEIERQVKGWLSSWVEPLCEDLIKEFPKCS